ncbi:thiocillin family RiPP [Bacillus sp. FSL W7-1360]
MQQAHELELFAEELPSQIDLAVPAGTWTSATTATSASCPASSASSLSTASSAG